MKRGYILTRCSPRSQQQGHHSLSETVSGPACNFPTYLGPQNLGSSTSAQPLNGPSDFFFLYDLYYLIGCDSAVLSRKLMHKVEWKLEANTSVQLWRNCFLKLLHFVWKQFRIKYLQMSWKGGYIWTGIRGVEFSKPFDLSFQHQRNELYWKQLSQNSIYKGK